MIVWLNGPFGGGKTTTAHKLVNGRPALRLFDPETVGYMLMANLRDRPVDDFQELRAWRSLVPAVAAEVTTATGSGLVAVQTVLVEDYWTELRSGFDRHGIHVLHVLLDCDADVLRKRIHGDDVERAAERWRLDHVGPYAAARPWLTEDADLVVDTSTRSPAEVAALVLAELR